MSNIERIEQLESYVKMWEEMLSDAVSRRDRALKLMACAVDARDDSGVDVLQKQANEADAAVLELTQCRTRAQSLLGRAQAGDDQA